VGPAAPSTRRTRAGSVVALIRTNRAGHRSGPLLAIPTGSGYRYPHKTPRTVGNMHVSCLIVDDDDGFLEVARGLLEREQIDVVGVASDSAGALRLATSARPDVVLIDVNLGDESGFDLVRYLAGSGDAVPPTLILISTYTLDDYIDLPTPGAAAFVRKSDLSGTTIRRILAGQDVG
jgi:CheY-like chemotaxis protein